MWELNLYTLYYLKKKFWEELVTYFSLIGLGPRRKRYLQKFFFAAGMSLRVVS
jgi:hypothetical protein